MNSKVNGVTTNIPLGFTTHAAFIDQSGQYTILYPAGVSDTQYVYDWNAPSSQAFTVMNTASNGHDAYGYGVRINKDNSGSPWDAGQWQFRTLANPAGNQNRISPLLTPQEIYMADHTSWHNAQPGALLPVLSGVYRYWDFNTASDGTHNQAPFRAWDNEIIAFTTTGTTTVWRFCHHWSDVTPDTGNLAFGFYYLPRPQIAPNGQWAIFTSNWFKTLGNDTASTDATTLKRQDVFLVQLK